MRVRCALPISLCLVLVGLLLPAAPGKSVARAAANPQVTAVPASAGPGESFALQGSGWPAGATLGANFYEAATVGGAGASVAGPIAVGADGAFSVTARVPLTLFGAGSRANLTVVPGSYTILARDPASGLSAGAPFAVGAPTGAGLLWGETVADVDGNGVRDPSDATTQALVAIDGPTADGTPVQAIPDGRGRWVATPLAPGTYHLDARANVQGITWTAGADATVGVGQAVRADLLLQAPSPSGLPASQVALQGHLLLVGSGDRLRALDLSDALHPAVLGASAPLGATVRSVAASGTTAFVLLDTGGVDVVDVSDPGTPALLATYPTPYLTRGIAIQGQYLLVPTGETLTVLDVSAPAQPRPVATYDPPGEVRSVTAAGRYAYVVTTDSTLRIVNLADPLHPAEVGASTVAGAGFLSEVAITHGDAFGTFMFGHYTAPIVFDVTDPTRPTQRPGVPSALYSGTAFTTHGDTLLVANQALVGWGSMGAVSLADPAAPTPAGSLVARWNPLALVVNDGLGYVLGGDGLLHVLDVSDPARLAEVSVAPIDPVPPSPPVAHDERYFAETGFRVDDDAVWDYLNARGGLGTFGYPVSRTFPFLGCPVQVFQRQVAQDCPGRGVALLNLLDPDLFPYTRVNGSTFPPPDEALKAATPGVDQPDYATAILDFVAANAPDEWEGRPVGFGSAFSAAVTPDQAGTDDPGILGLLDLEVWGAPISRPMADPNNNNFVYQRFQRGIMHYTAGEGTRGILLADYLKSVLLGPAQAPGHGASLPADLAGQAAGSRAFAQYCPGAPGWLCRPGELPGTDLTFAFETG